MRVFDFFRRRDMRIYELYIRFNDSYAFREYPVLTEYQMVHQFILPDMSGPPRPGIRRCKSCGELLTKWEECPDDIEIRNKSYDVSLTYDGVVVVSEAFRQVYDKGGLTGLRFKRLRCTPPLYYVWATRSVEFDSERSGTRFFDRCGSCGRYKTVVGTTPVFLRPESFVGSREFVRTDIEFASGDEKHPLLLCGGNAARALNSRDLKRLYLRRSLKGIHLQRIDSI